MAQQSAHLAQGLHNEKCAQLFIDSNEALRDWAITAAFYAAVHYVEAFFTEEKGIQHTEKMQTLRNIEGHKFRRETIKSLVPKAHADYELLYRASSSVRYLTAYGTKVAQDFFSEADARILIETSLKTVKEEIQKAYPSIPYPK